MTKEPITSLNKEDLNNVATHPLQSFEWGSFREKTHVTVIRKVFYEKGKIENGFQLTLHPIKHTPFVIGYLPKGVLPDKKFLEELTTIGNQKKCIFIQLEPNIEKHEISNFKFQISNWTQLVPSAHPLFTKFTFILDLTKSEEELLKNMHSKTRYNIRVAQKHGVEITEDNSENSFEEYLRLTRETTQRQGFYAHTESYHRKMWETLRVKSSKFKVQNNYDELTAHLLTAKYNNQILVAWILFVFKDTLYYPYGASSSLHREVMASNLMMWEAIRFGKKLGLKKFDMWGAASTINPDKSDPWYGFHRFKEGYGARYTEFIGSFDLIVNPVLYNVYKIADKLRWALLRLKK